MSSQRKCCVPGCSDSHSVLHLFPNPAKDLDRFKSWVFDIGGDIWQYSNEYIYKRRRICNAHFESKYCCRYNRISNIAMPTLNMPNILMKHSLKTGLIASQKIPFQPIEPKPNVAFLKVKNEKAGERNHQRIPTNDKERQATPSTSEETKLENNTIATKNRNVLEEGGNDFITEEVKGMDYDHSYVINSDDQANDTGDEKLLKPNMKNGSLEMQKQCNKQSKGSIFPSLQYTPNVLHVACAVEVKSTEDLEAPAMFRVCRICLAIDTKMFRITDFQLSRMYHQVTGILLNTEDQLPKALCWECVGRLISANRFRDRAVTAHSLLASKSLKTYMTIRDVKSINRYHNKLESTLVVKHFENDDIDLTICEGEFIKPEKVTEDEESESSDNNSNVDVPEEVMLEVKDEKIFVTEYMGFADEVFKGNKINRRKRIVKNESDADENILVEDSDNRTVGEVFKPKNISSNKKVKGDKVLLKDISPSDAMKRYKSASVLRRKKMVTLDENLFTITTPTFDEQIAEIQKRKEMYYYKTAPYKCTVCYRGFRTQERFENHAVKHSESSGQYECFICKARFNTASPLRDHITRQHSEKYSCNQCPFATNTRYVARRHQNYHAGVKYHCPHCQKEFDKVSTYMGHLRIKHPSKFVCELCGYAFINQWGVDIHKFKKHRHVDITKPLPGPYCAECDVRFLSEEAYARHLKLSSQHSREGDTDRIRNDSQCHAGRLAERRTDGARLQHTGPVGCEQCGVELASAKLYAQHHRRQHAQHHRRQHAPRRWMCDQCGKTFQSSVHLKSHMWVHTGEKCFKCEHCAKSFTNKASLTLHIQAHGGARPTHDCPLCGKQFTFHTNKKRHMLIHTGLKPFACSTCSKCFKTEAERRSHVDHVHLKKPWPKRTRPPARQPWRST